MKKIILCVSVVLFFGCYNPYKTDVFENTTVVIDKIFESYNSSDFRYIENNIKNGATFLYHDYSKGIVLSQEKPKEDQVFQGTSELLQELSKKLEKWGKIKKYYLISSVYEKTIYGIKGKYFLVCDLVVTYEKAQTHETLYFTFDKKVESIKLVEYFIRAKL